MIKKTDPEDDKLEFEIFRSQTLEEALSHVPPERRSRAIRRRKIID